MEERDPKVVERELRIERAVIGAVLHGYLRDNWGYNAAMTEALVVDRATAAEITSVLFWALSRLPRNSWGDEPDVLRDHLLRLYAVPDGD